jgi:hypothetical protein
MRADRGGADHAHEGLPESLCKIDFRRSGSGDIALTQFVTNPRHPGLHFEKYKTYRTLRVDQGRWRIAIRDLGNRNYELVDVDHHDRIDRRYSD